MVFELRSRIAPLNMSRKSVTVLRSLLIAALLTPALCLGLPSACEHCQGHGKGHEQAHGSEGEGHSCKHGENADVKGEAHPCANCQGHGEKGPGEKGADHACKPGEGSHGDRSHGDRGPHGAKGHGHGHGDHGGHGGHGNHEAKGHGHSGHDLNAAGFHHDFSDAEHWAKRFDAPERVEWQKPEEVTTLMGLKSGMSVADIGAGTGFFLGYLAAVVGDEGQVYALDVAESLIEHMTQRAKDAGWSQVKAVKIPYDSPGLEPASVDRILIVNTWHHIDSRSDYSAKLLRALKPGGAVFVVDYTMDSDSGPPKAHRLPPERVQAEMEAGGFVTEVMDESLPRQYVVRALRP